MNNPPNNKEFILDNLTDVKQVFLSFAAKISPVNFNLLLNYFTNHSEDVIYFSQPDKSVIFLSYDKLFVQSFNQNEFNLITNEIDILLNKLITNHDEFPEFNFPVFLMTAKFPSNKISEEWDNFNQINFIIPKISLYKNSENYFILYNTLSDTFSNHENLNEILEGQFEKIIKLESKLTVSEQTKCEISFIEESDDKKSWEEKISTLLDIIKSNDADKIVLARRLKYKCAQEINWQFIFDDLVEKYPGCTNFLIKSNSSIFFGSTPELFARFNGKELFTEALAGSIMRGSNPDEDKKLEDELLHSVKNKFEHDSVTNNIFNILSNHLESIEIDQNTTIKKLFYIQHLHTGIRGRLKPNVKILDIISSFFPTPAVCGLPKEKAIETISHLENFERGLFAGLFGWLNCQCSGEFNVTIRSALLKDNFLYVYAGGGIVEGSDANDEFDETNLKFKPILSLFKNAN